MRFVVVVVAVWATLLAACSGSEPAEPTPVPEFHDGVDAFAAAPMDEPTAATRHSQESQAQPEPTPGGVPGPTSLGVAPPVIQSAAVLLMDEESGAILHEVNAHTRLAPASLTKIATAVVVLESGIDLDMVLEVHPDLERQWLEDSAVMGLLPGDRFSVRELLNGLLMVSGNDAARELAVAVAGSEEAFVEQMNALATRLHLTDTHFTDVHGLGGPGHFTSAFDMARLAKYAMTLPVFAQIVGTETHTAVGSQELFLYNQNPLLNYTPGVDGVKVGYTEEAGPTFVASATRNGHRVYVVLLNAPAMPFDAIALIEWAFANHRWPAQ